MDLDPRPDDAAQVPAPAPPPAESKPSVRVSTEDLPSAKSTAPAPAKRKEPLRGILKPLPPPTQTQRLNASLQSSFSSFKRDWFSGFAPKEPANNNNSSHHGPGSATGSSAPGSSASQQPAHNVTLLNTNSNAGSSLWKSMSSRLTTLDPVHAATQLPLLASSAASSASSHSNTSANALNVRGMRAVRFRMHALAVTYPMGDNTTAPADESRTRDSVHAAQAQQLERQRPSNWTPVDLVRLYEDACRSREEMPLQRIRTALLGLASKDIDLTGIQLNLGSAEALSDVLSVDFDLKKLILDSCGLDDDSIKVILHGLLVSGSLPTLSLANNRRIKSKGWQYVAIFVRRAEALRFLDLSENSLDKRVVDWLVHAITSRPVPSVKQPNTDHGRSDHSSNKLSKSLTGLGLHDSPSSSSPTAASFLQPPAPLLQDSPNHPTKSHLTSLRLENASLRTQTLEVLSHAIRSPDSRIKHLSLRRNKITALGAVALAVMLRDHPDSDDAGPSHTQLLNAVKAASNEGNSMTSPTLSAVMAKGNKPPLDTPSNQPSPPMSPPRAISPTPSERFGSLLTLDVRSNDIRNGVTYIAQVLKRNRTLKVLNLCDNKIDSAGLVAIADALKTNRSLETLDFSKNPCCGPRLEGITALRSAFSHNSSLLRVFLAATDLSSEAAICLAEFLPDIKTLIHLDLTENYDIDIAGVMALAVSVKMNKTLRCLDLNIPPNDPDFSRLSQDILQSCIRNTECAQEESTARGIKVPVSAPMLKSAVARNLEEQRSQKQAASNEQRKRTLELLSVATQSRDLLKELTTNESHAREQIDVLRDVLGQARAAQLSLADAISASKAAPEGAFEINQDLIVHCNRAGDLLEPPRQPQLLSPKRDEPLLSSPTFSITDSDDESETEEASAAGPSMPKLHLAKHDRRGSTDSDTPKSPLESQSRNWVEEEGEVFRKKAYLDEQEDEDPEMTGEEMKKEILEAEVPRAPSREEGESSGDEQQQQQPPPATSATSATAIPPTSA